MIKDDEIEIAVDIILDENKIEREGIYDIHKIKNRMNVLFMNVGLNVQVSGRMYSNRQGQTKSGADAGFWGTIGYLKRCRWLMTNVKDIRVYLNGYEDIKKGKYESVIEAMKKTGSYYDMEKYWWENES